MVFIYLVLRVRLLPVMAGSPCFFLLSTPHSCCKNSKHSPCIGYVIEIWNVSVTYFDNPAHSSV